MDVNADGEKRHKIGGEDDEWQDVATENSSEGVQPETTDLTGCRGGPSFSLDPTTAPDFMAQEDDTLKMNGASAANGHELDEDDLDRAAEVLPPPQGGGGGNDYSAAKTGRMLTFADETGGNLVEMSYSSRTHYSKQAGPGAVQGVPKGGCCVIQ
ncbi:hypothetical protein P3T76_011274 [Phytophthora citrophthora]|uniref:Uncharacterized protein n=1 Tax=Phytophthora citrophthora TaxID=4793 RepID=A0AAD9GA75_9STRA|nr:hypothetical protein P3T76_011274 [Phytophthora citrophthora]